MPKVTITRDMIVASDAGGTRQFRKGETDKGEQFLTVTDAVFGRLSRAKAAVLYRAGDAPLLEVEPQVDLSKMTKAELLKLAAEKEITVDGSMTKAQIIAAITGTE